MAHNFRVPAATTGLTYYLSKAGIDTADGLTPDTPKLTMAGILAAISALASATVVKIIIGTGVYDEGFASNAKMAAGSSLVGDGNVICRGGINGNTFSFNASGGVSMTNIRLTDYGNSINLRGAITDCWFINCQLIQQSGSSNALRCKFINCVNVSAAYSWDYCIFIDCTLSGNNQFIRNTYCNANTDITLATLSSIVPVTNISSCNIMGRIRVMSTGNYQTLAQFQASNPGYFANSFNASPQFNGASKMDFTLSDNSPHIGAASDGLSNIGGTLFAKSLAGSIATEWLNGTISQSAGTPDLVFSGSDLIISPGKQSGTITSKPILVSANVVQIQGVNFNGFFLFNKSAGGGSAGNANVPDSSVRAGNNPDGSGNPDRLSYEARWTDNSAMPVVDADWTSTPLVAAGSFLRFEWNTKPVFDNMGRGNGQGTFDSSVTPGSVNAVWMQFRVTLTNLYV